MKVHQSNGKTIMIVIVIVLILGTGSVYAWMSIKNGIEIGEAQAEINKQFETNNEIVASVNGYEITKESFEVYKSIMSQTGDYGDEELLDKLIEKKLMYSEAVAEGFTVTDDEIEAAIEDAKSLLVLEENIEQYNFLKQYIEGLGITEEQYWTEIVKPIYRETFTINKLTERLRANYDKENSSIDSQSTDGGFSDYLSKYKEDLVDKANIQILESVK